MNFNTTDQTLVMVGIFYVLFIIAIFLMVKDLTKKSPRK